MSPLTRIATSSLREEAYRAIRAGIVTGEITSGTLYSTPSLARRLGVSATPVREAMLDLANEGLVEPVRNRGFRIVPMEDSDLDEILELRLLLEVPSAGRVAGTLKPDEIERLRQHVEELEQAAEDKDLAAYLAADHAFHLALLAPLGNRRLLDVVSRLRDQQRLYGLPGMVESTAFAATAAEHRAILDAVAAGEGRQAEELMRRHLRHTRGVWAGWQEEIPEAESLAAAPEAPVGG
jgi:DNA-binding GntR family transcriptional regulator